jgi:DNA-binding transcriptional MocR family regulator
MATARGAWIRLSLRQYRFGLQRAISNRTVAATVTGRNNPAHVLWYFSQIHEIIRAMISPYTFQPRGRLLDVMRQVGDPNLINLAAGLPSVHCVPKAHLREAFAATLEENADEALGYHVPDGDLRLRELLVDRRRSRGITTSVDKIVITTGCSQGLHGMIRLIAKPGEHARRRPITQHWRSWGISELKCCPSQ